MQGGSLGKRKVGFHARTSCPDTDVAWPRKPTEAKSYRWKTAASSLGADAGDWKVNG